jgi:hypothetical protein
VLIVTALTGLAIWKQAKESAQATKAMRESTDIQKRTLGGTLTIGFAESPIAAINRGAIPLLSPKINNTGAIAVVGAIPETWIELVADPFVDFSSKATHSLGERIAVYPSDPIHYEISLGRQLLQEEREALMKGTLLLCFRIRVVYPDTFDKGVARYVDCGYVVRQSGMEILTKYQDAN